MPTGYTAEVVDGKVTSFKQFALICARAFGALIEMRDQSLDANLPDEIKPSSYYQESLKSAVKEVGKLEGMDTLKKLEFGGLQKKKDIRAAQEYIRTVQIENSRIDAMIKKVLAWKPPTPGHVGMQDFMLQQLRTSKNDGNYAEKTLRQAEAKSEKDYYTDVLESARRSVSWAEKNVKEEQKRAGTRNDWLQKLKQSLQEE